MTDEELITEYWKGWHDEAERRNMQDWFKNDLAKRAYMVGRADYIIGDDVPSNDYRTEKEILKEIRDRLK